MCTIFQIALFLCLTLLVISTEGKPKKPSWWGWVKYPLFRTRQQQAEYEEKYYAAQNLVKVDTKYTNQKCTFSCKKRPPPFLPRFPDLRKPFNFRPKRESTFPLESNQYETEITNHKRMRRDADHITYHGCCISSHDFDDPPTAITASGVNVTLLQTEKYRQYFPEWECSHAEDCTGCTCMQETSFYTAVVWNGNSLEFDTIQMPGCCKCFNVDDAGPSNH